ncbi:hypothetical protein [Natrialba asiatica]|uniref:hypothetical protein n=1 Tax=Natrialba asiatica TaxID=64602 RepID=UPI000A85CF8B|nr:hypothetical protein [Natrialba asiatica]
MTDDDAARNAASDGTGETGETDTAGTDTGETDGDDAESVGTEASTTEPDNTDPDDANPGDTTDSPETLSLPRCPRCNTPIVQRTMIGPGEAIAGPCGCRVAPRVGTRSQSDSNAE